MTVSKGGLIKRNCSAGARQLALVFASLVAVSFTFGVAFAAQGLWMVLPFVGLEIVAVAAAFLAYGRHAVDFDRIELRDVRLIVERNEGSRRSEYVSICTGCGSTWRNAASTPAHACGWNGYRRGSASRSGGTSWMSGAQRLGARSGPRSEVRLHGACD